MAYKRISKRKIKSYIKYLEDKLSKQEKQINEALDLAFEYAQIDGGHHKMWVIDQMVRKLTGINYKEWVNNYEYDEETEEEYDWDTGIAP